MAKKISNRKVSTVPHINDALAVKIRKDGSRHLVPGLTKDDDVSSALAACANPEEIGQIAMEWGITPEEIQDRADRAPNFGQFRMVIGNRIRGIQGRLDEFDGDRSKAAYPKEAKRAARDAAKAAAAQPKTTAKVTKKVSKKQAVAAV